MFGVEKTPRHSCSALLKEIFHFIYSSFTIIITTIILHIAINSVLSTRTNVIFKLSIVILYFLSLKYSVW